MMLLVSRRTGLAVLTMAALGACGEKAPPAAAVEAIGYDSRVLVAETPEVKCYELARYFVVEKGVRRDVGSDVYVRPKTEALRSPAAASQRCTADSLAGDYVARNESAEYFDGMRNHWLFLDSGTGPARSIVLHNVDMRKRVLSVAGDHAGWRDSLTLLIWVDKGEQPRENCPDVDKSLGAGLDSLFALDLRTVSLAPVGRARCSERQ